MLIDISEHIEKEIKEHNESLKIRFSPDLSRFYVHGSEGHTKFSGVSGVCLLSDYDDDPILSISILDLIAEEVDLSYENDDLESRNEITDHLIGAIKNVIL